MHTRLVFGVGSVVCVLMLVTPLQSQQLDSESFRGRDVALELSLDYSAQRLSGSMTLDIETYFGCKHVTTIAAKPHPITETHREPDRLTSRERGEH